jgi:hypothetical protein
MPPLFPFGYFANCLTCPCLKAKAGSLSKTFVSTASSSHLKVTTIPHFQLRLVSNDCLNFDRWFEKSRRKAASNDKVVKMPNIMTFHPEWGCLAPAPSFMRTVRTVLVATAVGATAGSGVVFAFVNHSAGDQRSVSERTLVRLIPVAPTSASVAQTAQLSPQTTDQSEAGQVSRDDGQAKDPATNELNASSPTSPTIVAASDEVRMATGAKAAVAPLPSLQARQKRMAQGARHKDVLSASRQSQHSLPARNEPNAFQRLLAGLTAAIGHVWPVGTSSANSTSRAHGITASAATT